MDVDSCVELDESEDELLEMATLLFMLKRRRRKRNSDRKKKSRQTATAFHALTITSLSLYPLDDLSYKQGKPLITSASLSSSAKHKENAIFILLLHTVLL